MFSVGCAVNCQCHILAEGERQQHGQHAVMQQIIMVTYNLRMR